MPKKKILFFTDWFYPGFLSGGTLQAAYNLISQLKDYYDFSVITRDTDFTITVPYKDIKSDEWNNLSNGMRVYYFSNKNLSYNNMRRLIKSEDFDIAYLNSMYSPRFTIMPLRILQRMKKHVIIAPRGMLAPTAVSIKSWKKRPFLLWLKNKSIVKKIRFHAASELEAEHTRKIFGKKADIKFASDLPGIIEINSHAGADPFVRPKVSGTVHLINFSRISPEKNLDYALEVLMNVKGKVTYDIYGPVYDEPYWGKCRELISKLPANIDVKYHGAIAKDEVPAAMKDVHFLFLPTQGENFGYTILEAMTCGCPPIISDKTLWRDLESKKAGFDLPLEKPEEFQRVLEKAVLMDEKEYSEWSAGARNFASNFMNNPQLLQKSIELFQFQEPYLSTQLLNHQAF